MEFRQTTTICIERPVGTGTAVDRIGDPGNPFLATVGLRIDPARDPRPERIPAGAGFGLGIELGALPLAFLRAVEETVYATLRQGLHGWPVTDVMVTLTQSGYYPRQSHAHATFRQSHVEHGHGLPRPDPVGADGRAGARRAPGSANPSSAFTSRFPPTGRARCRPPWRGVTRCRATRPRAVRQARSKARSRRPGSASSSSSYPG